MKRVKNDPATQDLPPPVTLTPEQLAAVASETSAMLGNAGGIAIHLTGYVAAETLASKLA